MTLSLDKLSRNYLLRDQDPYFSSGRRSILRYAFVSSSAGLTQINQNGPEPFEYIEYAKSNLASCNEHGDIDALGHAKRAVHLIIDAFLKVWGLDTAYSKTKFPEKLKIMQEMGAFPIRMIEHLNKKRNLVEHEYISVKHQEAADFVDIADMFLLLSYPLIKNAVIGTYIGLDNDDKYIEWKIAFPKKEIHVSIVNCEKFIETSIGSVHYEISEENTRTIQSVVPIKQDNFKEWISFLDLFVYCTKRSAVMLPAPDSRGHGFFIISHSETYFD